MNGILAELEAKIRPTAGPLQDRVLGKGGVGKTTIAAGWGPIFAELRQDDRVVAIDADTAFGNGPARGPQRQGFFESSPPIRTCAPSPTCVPRG